MQNPSQDHGSIQLTGTANTTLQGHLRPREDADRRFDAAGDLSRNIESNSIRIMFGAEPAPTYGHPYLTLNADPDY